MDAQPGSEPAPRAFELALSNPCRYADVHLRRLRPWLAGVLSALAPDARSLAVLFTSDLGLRRLNGRFRGRDVATDVLSFPGGDSPEGPHLGDIAVSVPTARRQAAAAGHSVDRELRVLVLHGVLHCLGYDHEADEGEMERLERRLRRRYVANG